MEQVDENEVENEASKGGDGSLISNEAETVIGQIHAELDSLPVEFPAGTYPEKNVDPTQNPDTFRVQHPDENLVGLPPSNEVQKEEVVQAPEWCVIQAGESIPLKGYNFKLVGYAKGTFDLILRCVGPTGKTLKERAELAKKNAKRR